MSEKPTHEELEQRVKELEKEVLHHKQTEKELKSSEEKYKILIENSPVGIYYNDFYGRFLYGNKKAEEIIGYQNQELIGKSFLKLKLLIPKDTYRASKLIALNRLGKATGPDQFLLNRKDGSKAIVQINTEVIKIEGKKVVLGMAQDITERKQAEDTLRESEEKYRTLSEQSTDAIYITTKEGKLSYINRSFLDLFGYTKEEIEDLKAQDMYVNLEDRSRFQQEAEKTGAIRDFEVKLRKKDGTEMDCLITANIRKSDDGSILGYQGIIRNITEQKNLQSQLLQAQKMEAIGTLAGGIAHNFNNLLMSIQGNTSLMLLDTDSNHLHYQRLTNIEKLVQSGSKLTSQLLGYARGGRYEVKPISMNQIIKETSATFSMTKKDITIHQDLDKDLYGVKADLGQIEQVLLNIYVNAAEAMPGGGDLFLHTINVTHKDIKGKPYKVKPGEYILLTIRDTGIGMDKETKDKVFDPFFTTKGLAKGTGLGLASVYGIIKAHGGYIDVESKKGQGTTFYIYLPATKAEGIAQRAESESGVEIIQGKETVLLVDDEEIIIDVGQELLKTLGYNVLIAEGGREAVDIYKANKDNIDIVILDMIMPVIGGGEAYDRMKEINPNIKVLLSSGYSINGQATEILKRGCDGFIQKPFTMRELSKAIRGVLEKK